MSLLAQDERLTRKVGAATLLVIGAAIVFVLVIYDRIEWGARVRIDVYFQHTGGLREGAPVVLAGQSIGSVEAIARTAHGASTPLGGEEGIVVRLALSSRQAERIPRGGDIFVASRGALSERYVELGPAPDPTIGPYTGGEQVRGKDPPTLDRVLNRTWKNLQIAREFAEALRPELERLRTELRALADTLVGIVPDVFTVAELVVEVRGAAAELDKLRAAVDGANADAVLSRARDTVAQARRMFDTLGERAKVVSVAVEALGERAGPRGRLAVQKLQLAIDRMRAAAAKIEPMLAVVDQINQRIARGEGTIGRLSRDPEFPEDAKELGKILKRQPWRIFGRPDD